MFSQFDNRKLFFVIPYIIPKNFPIGALKNPIDIIT